MKPLEIESWALRVLELVEKRQHVEDLKAELKSEWPKDFNKTARQLAGHANFARGENILWLIGADEKQGIVTGANYADLASWFPQVQAAFESVYPSLAGDISVAYKGKSVSALCFETSRFPYVVKNPAFGKTAGDGAQYEVPWREGTKTRTATRSDLVLMLSPLIRMPRIEVLEGIINHRPSTGPVVPHITFNVKAYVTLQEGAQTTFPFHKCSAVLSAGNEVVADRWDIRIDSPRGKAERFNKRWATLGQRHSNAFPSQTHVDVHAMRHTIEGTADEVIMRGSGMIEIDGSCGSKTVGDWPEMSLTFTLAEAVSGATMCLNMKFLRTVAPDHAIDWRCQQGAGGMA